VLLLLAGFALFVAFAWLLRPSGPPSDPNSEVRGIYRILWWVNQAYCAAWHHAVYFNKAPLPAQGPAILIANHTCGVDNFLLQAGCRRTLGFLIAEQIYNVWPISVLARLLHCIPVNRDGHDVSAIRAALRVLGEGRIVPIFPEGRITPSSGREFGEPRPGAAFLALKARVPVIPAYIRGTPETNNVWKAGRTPSNARILFGEPLDLTEFFQDQLDHRQEKELIAALTKRLMDSIKDLRARSLELESTI
jgi:1-acyl-sn-glycerol-3-phosphate acyltransferase